MLFSLLKTKMSAIVQYLRENNITKYKIFHKKITNVDIVNGKLVLDLFDKVPHEMKKRAIYFMLNNININEYDHCSMFCGQTSVTYTRELNYFRYIQQNHHMKSMSNESIYMYSFCLHPTEQTVTGHTLLCNCMAQLNKKDSIETIELNGNSSITYVVQYAD